MAGMAIRDAAQEENMPEGVFSLLFDGGKTAGQALVSHPGIRAVGFTGSRAGGTALAKLAASRAEPIPFYAEMSSVNPVFVLPSALASRAEALAKEVHSSVTLGVGQFCTNPGVLVMAAKSAAFTSRLAELMSQTPPEPMLNRNIATAYHRAVAERSKQPRIASRAIQAVEGQSATGPCLSSAALFQTDASTFVANPELQTEIFGPSTLIVEAGSRDEILNVARQMGGNLTAAIHGTEQDLVEYAELVSILETKVGRIIFNGLPTGVEVCNAMVHGGPWPSTSDGRSTSVGGRAILRFSRPVAYQDFPDSALPSELRDSNPSGIWRLVDSKLSR